MTIVKWDPFRDVATLQDRINRLFNESFGQTRDLERLRLETGSRYL